MFKNDFTGDTFDEEALLKGFKMQELLTNKSSSYNDEHIKQIIKLADMDGVKKEHRNVILQSVEYSDCDFRALYGEYNKSIDDTQNATSPVIAALFLPKF